MGTLSATNGAARLCNKIMGLASPPPPLTAPCGKHSNSRGVLDLGLGVTIAVPVLVMDHVNEACPASPVGADDSIIMH